MGFRKTMIFFHTDINFTVAVDTLLATKSRDFTFIDI